MNKISSILFLTLLLSLGCNTAKNTSTAKTETETDATMDTKTELGDARLHDIWVVTAINEEAIPKELSKPRLEIFPVEGRITGNGSCNEFFGKCTVDGKKITFTGSDDSYQGYQVTNLYVMKYGMPRK